MIKHLQIHWHIRYWCKELSLLWQKATHRETRTAFIQYPPLFYCVSAVLKEFTSISYSIAMTTSYTEWVLLAVESTWYQKGVGSSWDPFFSFFHFLFFLRYSTAVPCYGKTQLVHLFLLKVCVKKEDCNIQAFTRTSATSWQPNQSCIIINCVFYCTNPLLAVKQNLWS